MDKTPVNAHQDEPRTLGGRLPRIVADVLSHDRAFLDAVAQQGPRSIEGTVTATQRDSSGANRVQIKRTGQAASEAAWYTVWNPMHVPIVGDIVRLLIVGKGAAVILGAKHGGRPNEHTIAYTGGAHHHYDSARNHIHKHGDDHHHRHYHTDGTTITHHHHGTSGHHAHTGNHRMGGGGGLVLADDGTPSGTWHEKAHHNGRYEHSQSGTLVRHHDVAGDHGHYSNGALIHNIVAVGTAGGQIRAKQHNSTNMHHLGDDGGGLLYLQHGNGLRALQHDGTNYTHFCGGNTAMLSVLGQLGTGIYSHHFYHTAATAADTELAVIDAAGSSASTAGGRLRFKVYNGPQAGSGTPHLVGDDGTGNMHALSQSGLHNILISNGAGRHQHAAGYHMYPTNAYHNAPAADSSRLDSVGAGGNGGIKKPSHSYTAGTQDYAWTIGTGGTGGPALGANGSNTDPHFKFVATNTWSGTNIGFYIHPTPTPHTFGGALAAAVVGWGHPVSTGSGTWDWNSAYHAIHVDANAVCSVAGKSTASTAVTTSFLWSVVNS